MNEIAWAIVFASVAIAIGLANMGKQPEQGNVRIRIGDFEAEGPTFNDVVTLYNFWLETQNVENDDDVDTTH